MSKILLTCSFLIFCAITIIAYRQTISPLNNEAIPTVFSNFCEVNEQNTQNYSEKNLNYKNKTIFLGESHEIPESKSTKPFNAPQKSGISHQINPLIKDNLKEQHLIKAKDSAKLSGKERGKYAETSHIEDIDEEIKDIIKEKQKKIHVTPTNIIDNLHNSSETPHANEKRAKNHSQVHEIMTESTANMANNTMQMTKKPMPESYNAKLHKPLTNATPHPSGTTDTTATAQHPNQADSTLKRDDKTKDLSSKSPANLPNKIIGIARQILAKTTPPVNNDAKAPPKNIRRNPSHPASSNQNTMDNDIFKVLP